MPLLLKWTKNWADEFDMAGFCILTAEAYKEFIEEVNNANYPVDASFGTNESYTFENIDEVLSGLDVVKLTEEEADKFMKLFGNKFYNKYWGFGWTPVGHF